jgi:anti-sigma regulatory factor (Ser/Thr protein kinase)
VTYVIEVPAVLDERSFDQFAAGYAGAAEASRVLVDAHATNWASPAGLIGLLCAGQALAARGGPKPLLTAPADKEVTHYWTRAGFFAHAADLFEVHGSVPRVKANPDRNVLLEVTPVTVADDVHAVVGRIQERAAAILTTELGLDPKVTMGFGMALSEACQNIVEHAGTGGWVAVQRYSWRSLGRKVVVIAVADAGVGFRHTLEATQASRFGDRWSDATALEAALIQGVSRFRDPGRGQGLAGIRRYLSRWHGKISIRSGTARIAIVPDWEKDEEPLRDGLARFPGAQLQLVVPEVEREAR